MILIYLKKKYIYIYIIYIYNIVDLGVLPKDAGRFE